MVRRIEVINARKICIQAISFVALAGCFHAFGCRSSLDDLTVWKTEMQSPDGLWIATARTIQNGGFGSASIDTVVYLKPNNSPQPSKEVLTFSCQGPVPHPYTLDNVANAGGTIDLMMRWATPSHLEVTYNRRKGNLGLRINDWSGLTISVRDIASK